MSDCGITTGSDDTPASPTFAPESEVECASPTDPNAPNLAVGGPTFEHPEGETPPPAETFWGPREYQFEFDTETHVVDGASVDRRPDAVSLDYLTAFSIGPVNIGDASEGARARVWRAKAYNNEATNTGQIRISRSNDANDAWEPEFVLFNFAGNATEIDLAFEQAGRAVIVLEISGRIKLYWFDPNIPPNGEFTLTDFDDGRTPRCLLDNPLDTTDSDVLVFYIRDASDKIVYRQQRDRYQNRIDTPYTGLTNRFLEDAIKTLDNRVGIVISVRNTVTGRYSLDRLDSTLYPYFTEVDPFQIQQAIQSGLIEDIVIVNILDLESFQIQQAIQSGTLALVLISHTLYDIDAFQVAQLIQSGALDTVVIVHTLYDIDQFQVQQAIQSGALVLVVIVHTLYDMDEFQVQQQIQSGLLEVA